MTARDRLVVIVLGAVAVLAGAWLLAVSPERKQANELATQVSAASSKLAAAESQVANARAAQANYAAAYAAVVKLGKAVPAAEEVPSLIYELSQASQQKNVDFSSIVSGSSASSSATSASSAAAVAANGGITPMPFTFVFNGSFASLFHLFQQLNAYTARTVSGGLVVNGRLLTVQSLKLAPFQQTSSTAATGSQLTGTITATAYVLSPTLGLTGGATPSGPAAGPSASPVSSSRGSSGPAPALVKATP